MSTPEPMTVLLVSAQAEEIKLLTMNLRGFYPGCRVEAVYSPNEAIEWASKEEWHVVLLDEHVLPGNTLDLLFDLRRRAPHGAIIVLAHHSDAATATRILQGGADDYLVRKSTGILTELMVAIREVLEKRDLRGRIDLTRSRYLRLVELIPDLIYELDGEGRFSFISQNVASLLGYSPQELIGTHYSSLLQALDRHQGDHRIDERRTGARATRGIPFRLVPKKDGPTQTRVIEVEITAKGLYDQRNRFVGTIGIARDLTNHNEATERMQRLDEQTRQAEQLIELRQVSAKIADELSSPLAGILDDTAELLKHVEELRLERRLQQVLSNASRAARLGKDLAASTLPHTPLRRPVSINALIEEALSISAGGLESRHVTVDRRLEAGLPSVLGDAGQLRRLLMILIKKAEEPAREAGAGGRLQISTYTMKAGAGATASVTVEISADGQEVPAAYREDPLSDTEDEDWKTAHHVLTEHGGTVEASPSSRRGLLIRISLPASAEQMERQNGRPQTVAAKKEEAALAPTERRRAPRAAVPMEARLTQNEATWVGSVSNFSLGGLHMVLEGIVPAAVNQPVQMGLTSAAGVLLVRGALSRVEEVDRRRVGPKVFPAVGLAVEFGTLEHDEALSLASLLDSIAEQTLSVSLTALLPPADTGDLLVGAGSREPEITLHMPLESFPPESHDIPTTEHRFATRLNFVMPARVDIPGLSSEGQPYPGRTVNLSRAGVCLRLQGVSELRVGRRLVLYLLPPQSLPGQPPETRPGTAEYRLRAEVAWVTPVPSFLRAPSGSSAVRTVGALRVGIRFLHLDEDEERRVAELVAGFLNYPLRIEESGCPARLVSTFMECKNQKSHRVGISYDRPRKPLPPSSPLVIISPGFGETKRDYLALAYALASNGFHVLRYDHTDHVGESEGDMAQTTCTGMKQDLLTLLRFAAHTWPTSPIVLVAAGMAGRVALRVVSPQVKVNLLILLGSILDIGATLHAVHGEDVIGAYPKNARLGVINILGWNVGATCWLGDVIQGSYSGLRSTIKDAEKITIPTILFAAESDPWVPYPSVQEVQAALGPHLRRTQLLPEPFHRLNHDPQTNRALSRQIVADCLEHCYPAYPRESVQDPPPREISRQKLLEQERARGRHGGARPVTADLWRESPGIAGVAAESSDYWRFLDDIYRLMGQPQGDKRILDAACGNGELGMALMINLAYSRLNARTKECRGPYYVALDARGAVAAQARENLLKLAVELRPRFAAVEPDALVRASFSRAHLHGPLPFQDNSFDRIVCNLAIGGLPDPLSCVREFTRILAPNGKLVLTSFKPDADLTELYRNLRGTDLHGKDREQAQRLLRNWGTLLEQHRNGIFHFFDKREFLALLTSAGVVKPRIYATLGDQAYLAVAEKPA